MMGFDYSHGWSSTKWETSFYGGYTRTLYDHAEIKTDYNIRINPSLKSSLSYYLGTKLAKLFLLKCKTYNLLSTLLTNSKLIIEEPKWYYTGAKSERFIVISNLAKESVLNYLYDCDTEMANLFKHYEKDILDTEIAFKINNPNDEDDTGKSKSYTTEVGELLESIKVLKPYSSYNPIGDGSVPDPEFIYPYSYKNYHILSKDKLLAKQLVEKLDISFDSDKDVIKSLKAGKLDINKLAEAVAGNEHIYQRVEEDQITKPFSIVILCDESGSMGRSKLMNQHRLVKILYEAFSEILPQDKISVYGHTGSDVPNIYIYQDKYNLTFQDKIEDMLHRDLCENYDGPVIEAIHERIRSSSNDNILFIVISDGQPAGEEYGGEPAINDLKRIIEKCKRDNFVAVGIGFEYGGVKDIYKYHTIIHNFDKMVQDVSALLNKVVKTEFQ